MSNACSDCNGLGATVWIPPDLTTDPMVSTCSACSGHG